MRDSLTNKRIRSIPIAIFCILLIHYLFLAANNKFIIANLLLSCHLIIFIGLSLAWKHPLPPGLTFGQEIQILFRFLLKKPALVFSIHEGCIDPEFFLVKEKPREFFLRLDSKSAAVAQKNQQRAVLVNGIHLIDHDTVITHIISLGLQNMHIGPLDSDVINTGKRLHWESLAEYHRRISRVNQTRTVSQDGEIISPSFSIFYQLFTDQNHSEMKARILDVCDQLDVLNIRSEVQPQLDSMVMESWMEKWRGLAATMNGNVLLKEFSNAPRLISDAINSNTGKNRALPDQLRAWIFIEKIRALTTAHDNEN